MLERTPVVGDFLMWPDNNGPQILYVHILEDDKFAVTYLPSMGEDNIGRSVHYVTTGTDDWISEEDRALYAERAEGIRFATPEEVKKALRDAGLHVNENHIKAMRNARMWATRKRKLKTIRVNFSKANA